MGGLQDGTAPIQNMIMRGYPQLGVQGLALLVASNRDDHDKAFCSSF